MTKTNTVRCTSCGFDNPSSSGRCISCGAKLTLIAVEPGASQSHAQGGSYQQEGFSLLWLLIAFVIIAVLTASVVVGLPMVIDSLDFEGIYGMYMCVPVWFVAGILVGLISPGKTFIEPVVASLVVAVPTVMYLVNSQTVRTMPTFMYIILGCAGIMFTLIGTYLGERIQLGPPPRASE